MDKLIDEVLNGDKEDIIQINDNIVYQITTTDNQKNNIYKNISTIDLQGCEDYLKAIYNISKNDTLLIFKYDYSLPGLLIPIVGYEAYHPVTKEVLDLHLCKINNTKIDVEISVQIDENEIYKHDPNDNYYKDKCHVDNNTNGVDITLYDKKNIFNEQNLALCANNCDFDEYDNITKKVKCLCEPMANNSLIILDNIINKKRLLNNFIDIHSTTNFDIIKCYEMFLIKEGLEKNIGSYILLSILLIHLISFFVFFCVEYKLILKKINNILDTKKNVNNNTNNYINNNNNNNVKNIIKNNPIKKGAVNSIKIDKIINIRTQIDNSNNITNDKKTKLDINSTNKLNNILRNNDKNKIKRIIRKNNGKIYNNSTLTEKNFIESELNSLDYIEAKKYDNRNFIQFYFSLIKTRHPLISSFIPNNDYNSTSIKICIFLFSFTLSFIVNSFFFTDETMHKIFQDEGIFNFVYNLPKIIYSTLISIIIDTLIKKLGYSHNAIISIIKEKSKIINNSKNSKKYIEFIDKVEKTKRNLTIKFILFYVISIILLSMFWFYIGCFCAVYKNTQIYLLKDTLFSFSLSLILPFVKYFIPCIIRINSLRDISKTCYNFIKLFQ